MSLDLEFNYAPPRALRTDLGIGALGAGFIMRDVQLKAYASAGFKLAAITSRTRSHADAAAALYAISHVYDSLEEMLEDPDVAILDIAIPPHLQVDAVRKAVAQGKHLKGILAQKPLAAEYADAERMVNLCHQRGLILAVNQNMRYDQAIRALKDILTRGYLGEPVLATIEMRAVPHWQDWLPSYGRLTLLNMSVHHLDAFRYLFGDPEAIFVSARPDPRTTFEHVDGICLYILEYANGLRASAWDDVWTGPRSERDDLGPYIKWRVEGTEGIAEGTIGWPLYPNRTPSTLSFTSNRQPGVWFTPKWRDVWFPDAFAGPMADLINAIETGSEPPVSGRDNLNTMALIEAGYRSIRERRAVLLVAQD